jgi:transposase
MVVDGNFNGVVFLRFLNKLVKSFTKKVFLIADNHPVHFGIKISAWLAVHKQQIEMFPLPGYSPELNPVEYFNQDLKTNVAGKARPRDKQILKKQWKHFQNEKRITHNK